MNIRKLVPGSILSETSFFTVKEVKPNAIAVIDDYGNNIDIGNEYVEKILSSADIYDKEKILLKDITEDHLVVGIISGNPCILGKGFRESENKLIFFLLHGGYRESIITVGNGYSSYKSTENYLHHIIERFIKNGNKVEAFESKDWRKALKWLIDNTPNE